MSVVVATVCLVLLTAMSVVRAIYRAIQWENASSSEDGIEQMYAFALAVIMGVLSVAALIAVTRNFN